LINSILNACLSITHRSFKNGSQALVLLLKNPYDEIHKGQFTFEKVLWGILFHLLIYSLVNLLQLFLNFVEISISQNTWRLIFC
jgi:hypothetical protein